jgi:hypothetical protein
MQLRQQITWCWLQKKSIIKSGCLEHFSCVVSTSPGKVDITWISMTWWVIDTLFPLCYLFLRIIVIGNYLYLRITLILCQYLYLSRITVTCHFLHSGIQSAIDIRIKCGFVFIPLGMFGVIRCHFKWHDLITWAVIFWHAVSTAHYMMLVAKKVHNKIRMSWTFFLCCQYFTREGWFSLPLTYESNVDLFLYL